MDALFNSVQQTVHPQLFFFFFKPGLMIAHKRNISFCFFRTLEVSS